MRYFTMFPSPLGSITAVCENGSLTGLWLSGQNGFDPNNAVRKDDDPLLTETRRWLERYFAGDSMACTLPLAPYGTAFQRRVWGELRKITYGKTVTYGQIAATFGGRMSPQAVGQAVGRNPISILIPCHRVLGAGGKLTGYAGGLDKKIALLELEGIPYIR